jgi:hypothetical protein
VHQLHQLAQLALQADTRAKVAVQGTEYVSVTVNVTVNQTVAVHKLLIGQLYQVAKMPTVVVFEACVIFIDGCCAP